MTEKKKSATAVQVGGTHYNEMLIQPWDYTLPNNIGHGESTAIEYLSRWRRKGGIQDLRKAIQWIEKVIEVEQAREAAKKPSSVSPFDAFAKALPKGKYKSALDQRTAIAKKAARR